jgi:subtilisin family serine protease
MRKCSLRRWFVRCIGGVIAAGVSLAPAFAEGFGNGGALHPSAADYGADVTSPSSPASNALPRAERNRPRRTPAPRVLVKAAPRPPAAIVRAFPPPPGEQRLRRDEIVVEFASNTPRRAIDLILLRHGLTESETDTLALLGSTIHLWRIPAPRDAAGVVRELASEALVASAQPNYVYALQDDAAAAQAAAAGQYSLAKLHVDAARALATGDKVLVAVVDTAIDETHPDLSGVVEARFDAIGGGAAIARGHGTSIAGAIAAHGAIQGVAPQVRILAVRAFDSAESGPLGTTLSILKGVDWAAQAHARVINMSFAGPQDPAMHRIIGAAFDKGIMLVAAAGNGGRQSAPLFPGAEEKVMAVTATDSDDKLFGNANVGRYIAVAAPGVDVLLPSPDGKYELQTGTSVSAALVSGVAALVLERHPSMQPAALRKLLMNTATPLGGGGHENEFGAGLVDAQRALADNGAAAR